MLLKYFYDKALAQASYVVACQKTKEAVVIDPMRHIEPYLTAAQEEGLTIRIVTETHIHADFVSGARELAAATGGALYLSGAGGTDWQYRFLDPARGDRALHDGDTFSIGQVRIGVLHTPGHTPEHLCFTVTDGAHADKPMGIFTGDCVFVGDLGRPDLLETAAGLHGSAAAGARGQWENVQRFRQMPDYLQIYPGHGAGSACGKDLGAVPTTTVGYEKQFNPGFMFHDAEAFARWLLSDQPETPRYFQHMKRINREGPPLLADLPTPETLEGFALADMIKSGANVIDARYDARDSSVIAGTIRILPGGTFSTYAGWMVDYDQPTYLIADAPNIERLIQELRAVGIDRVTGVFPPGQVEASKQFFPSVSPEGAQRLIDEQHALVIDVRAAGEYAEGHIPGALNLPYGLLADHLAALPQDRPLIVHCQSGVRSQIAMSLLLKHGFTHAVNLAGGYAAWQHQPNAER
ncbi:MAG: rhodanese-like domain-containing protein [bacterium]|nr:rhodanese-like domain-containing protein [bacterium]